jgi:hypothetical protein
MTSKAQRFAQLLFADSTIPGNKLDNAAEFLIDNSQGLTEELGTRGDIDVVYFGFADGSKIGVQRSIYRTLSLMVIKKTIDELNSNKQQLH